MIRRRYGIPIKALPIKTLNPVKPKVKKERIKRYSNADIIHFNKLESRGIIDDVVLSEMDDRDNEIIYGAKGINRIVDPYLRRHTDDYDIFSSNPERSARDVERKLERRFGNRNFFQVAPAKHENTWKLTTNSGIGGGSKPIADFTKPNPYGKDVPERERKMTKEIQYHKFGNVNVVTSDWQIRQAKSVLRDPESAWRHQKEQSKLNRLRVATPLKKKTYVYIPPKQKVVNGERFSINCSCKNKHLLMTRSKKLSQNDYRIRSYHTNNRYYLYSKKRR